MGQYVKDGSHVNAIEGFWSLLKNGIVSTHKAVSAKHLEKYAKEFEYRYNSRDNSAGMFPELITEFKKG